MTAVLFRRFKSTYSDVDIDCSGRKQAQPANGAFAIMITGTISVLMRSGISDGTAPDTFLVGMGSGNHGHARSDRQVEHLCTLCGFPRVVQVSSSPAVAVGHSSGPGAGKASWSSSKGHADRQVRADHSYHDLDTIA
jgi:hypothetical protein